MAAARDRGPTPAEVAPLTVSPAPGQRPHHGARPIATPVTVALDPVGFIGIQTPFTAVQTPRGPVLVRVPHYQGPDGTYDTPADLTRAINGVPCGEACTARALQRWGYQP